MFLIPKIITIGFLIGEFISVDCFAATTTGLADLKDPGNLRIALALRDKPDELSAFLSLLAGRTPAADEKISAVAVTEVMDDRALALKPVLVRDQETLSLHDILATEKGERQYLNVFEVTLPELDFSSTNGAAVIKFLQETSLPNLRTIELFSARQVKGFVNALFGATAPENKFYSLIRINASRSDVASEDLDVLFDHFKRYGSFIRDMEQMSGRYNVPAASLSVAVDDCAGMSRGIHKSTYPATIETYYRTGGTGKAIFTVVKQ